jgi:flagellar biosynthesis/type III secretory pathway chaperone
MKVLTEDLTAILKEQLALYDQVAELLEEERSALISKRPDQVLALVRRKETLLLRIKTLDESRRLVCARIAHEWRVPPASVTLREVEKKMAGSPTADTLAADLPDLRRRMTQCMEKLREGNARNVKICQNGIDVIRRIVQSAAEADAQTNRGGYGPKYGRPGAAGVGVRARSLTQHP